MRLAMDKLTNKDHAEEQEFLRKIKALRDADKLGELMEKRSYGGA